ncbi:MAG: hypothetical protein U1F10_12955 [Burkholderiales bacterium]
MTCADEALSAISARLAVLELAIAALVPTATRSRRLVSARFDASATELEDQLLGLAVDDAYLQLVEQSVADIRCLLDGGQ